LAEVLNESIPVHFCSDKLLRAEIVFFRVRLSIILAQWLTNVGLLIKIITILWHEESGCSIYLSFVDRKAMLKEDLGNVGDWG
jgi:hypothetical protein